MLKEDLKKMSKKKLVGLILLAVLAIYLWQLSIPVIIVWLVFEKVKTKKVYKVLLSMLLVFVYLGILGSTGLLGDNNTKTTNSGSATNQIASDPKKEAELRAKELEAQKQIEENGLKLTIEQDITKLKNYKATDRDSVIAITAEVGLFSLYAEDINKAKNSSNAEIKKLGTEAEPLLKKVQVKEFPVIRKKYVEAVKGKLWENNIDIYAIGTGNSTLSLVGGTFASNKNIMTMQGNIQSVTELLRFKKVEYKWYSGADSYYYTNDEAKADNEL